MSELLTSISSFCGSANLPGFRQLKYLPVDWLDTDEYEEYITTSGNFQKAIVPSLGGQAWLTLPFQPRGEGWEQSHRKTDQGDEYSQQIEGIMQQLRPEVEAEFDEMTRHRFLVQFIDRNGKPWLIGRQYEPLEFLVTGQTGASDGGLNGYRFRFAGTTTRRAFGYVPVF